MSSSYRQPEFKLLLKHPTLMLGFGFGSGLISYAPGTWGTLLGTLLFLPLVANSIFWAAVVIAVGAILGIYICGRSARLLNTHDHPGIVWDEFVGVWLVLVCLPEQTPYFWVLTFLVFRFFDVLKPWPIRWLDQRVSGGFGIMIDDIMAACYSIIFIWVLSSGLFWLN